MPCATQIHKSSQIIRDQAEMISDASEAPSLNALVFQGIALGMQWRSWVEYLSDSECFREARPHASGAMALCLQAYAKLFALLSEGTGGVPADDLADLKIAHHEVENIAKWIDTWPKSDPERHHLVRAEIAEGLDRDVGDLLSTCQ